MSVFHEQTFKSIFCSATQPINVIQADNVLQSLSSNKSIVLCPLVDPPSRSVAEQWLVEFRRSKTKSEDQSVQRPPVDLVEDETMGKPGPSSQSSIVLNSQSSFSTQMSDGNASVKLSQHIREVSSSSSKLSPLVNQRRSSCLIEEATADNSGAFKMEFQNLQEASNSSMFTFLTLCVMELHVNTRSSLKPNPEYDAIEAIFYVITNDVPAEHELPAVTTGIIMIDTAADLITSHDDSYTVDLVSSEKDMYLRFISILHRHDPDILAGYEIEMSSWGYLIHRGYIIGINMCSELSRLVVNPSFKVDLDQLKMRDYDIKISGRILLNVWRMMKHEVSLMSYSFENMAYHILHTRVPHYSHQTLTLWWNHLSSKKRILTMKYYLTRVRGIVKLLDSLNLIGRTSEMASLFGIQFYEVLSRGSQFRVESMMIRLAKPLNYVAVSPDVQQRADMRAPACLPLIMEPESRFYSDPIIVLDFQSLYPSMMIAYNYCFSTCLGRVEEIIEVDRFKFGCTDLTINPKELHAIKDSIHISPAGVAFVGSAVRKGVLPCMLDEILETRLMVKKSMKAHKNNKILHRVLDARQMGLKLIANVTYGYTSANFSGRMPCIEVGDSVVSKGRETLERAIKLVKETARWKAEVVYGDTDSLFVLCPGRTKEEAFAIGREIADAVTNSNPRPVKLKLEKVYQPCILQTKKRYVGYMYETPDQETPIFEAKGIETVRRDGCVAVVKMLEKSLRILFETYDVSKVKKYVCDQLTKISSSKLNLQDLIFAREYRGMKGYKPTACVPALQLVRDWLTRDPRAEPRVGERVGYCIVYGPPGVPLIRLVRDPIEVLSDPTVHINGEYYITKVILPPLQRCLTLLGVDTFSWYKSLPRVRKSQKRLIPKGKTQKSTLSQFFATVNCIICHEVSTTPVCSKCRTNEQLVVALISQNIARIQRKAFLLNKICSSCCGRADDLLCDSLNCTIYYRKCLSNVGLREMDFLMDALSEF
uniref:DNA polymerase n=1 Tax=Lygus hesperus TaxID=30085 RepID=A0A0A9YUF5_LYGHE